MSRAERLAEKLLQDRELARQREAARRACGQEFESKGLAFCAQCLEIPAEERRLMKPVATGRLCQAPGCENFVPKAAKANTRYCSDACQQRAKRARRDRDNRAGHPDSPQPLNATQNAPGEPASGRCARTSGLRAYRR